MGHVSPINEIPVFFPKRIATTASSTPPTCARFSIGPRSGVVIDGPPSVARIVPALLHSNVANQGGRMARPRTRCQRCGLRTKSPHGLFIHDLRVHKRHNWNNHGLYRQSKKAKRAA